MNLTKEFDNILKTNDINSLFQPIIRLNNGEVIGYEALSRGPKDSHFHSPLNLLEYAEKENRLWELEQAFRINSIKKAKTLKKDMLLFINCDPNIIKDSNFSKGLTKEFLSENSISPEAIVFEITERTAITDYDSFLKILNNYTDQGYKIAIDDAGSGYSGLKTITKTKPNYIKIDMELIRDIDKDLFKQALLKAFVNLSITTNTKLIAEGIETRQELKTLINLGIYAGQGYFIQRPASVFLDTPDHIKSLILKYNRLTNNIYNYNDNYHFIGDIMDKIESHSPDKPCEEIKDKLQDNDSEGLCLVKNEYPVGLIMKHALDSHLAKKYGYAVFSRRPISLVMDRSPLIVDYYTPIKLVTKEAMNRDRNKTYDNIIVTKADKYAGLISIKKLLEYSATVEKNHARELNPLTSLPGNVIINRVLKDTITYSTTSCVLYGDLDNFKVYNDVYGFENGDKIIKMVGDVIKDEVKRMFPFNSFIGHIGGDDFVFIIETTFDKACLLSQNVIDEFDNRILDFFNDKDKENGFIEAEDRFGSKHVFNLTSLSIAGIYGDLSIFNSVEELSQEMASIKKDCKKTDGSCYQIKTCNYLTNLEEVI